MLYDKIFKNKFDCNFCEGKKCNQKTNVYLKCLCNGEDENCSICNGKGVIEHISVCPNIYVSIDTKRLLPYFYRYLKTDEYPNKLGIYFQNCKLIECFEMMTNLYYRYDKITKEK